MGLFDDKDDKTEPATAKRLADARSKGQVAVSQELSTSIVMLAALIALEATGPWIMTGLQQVLRRGLTVEKPRDNGIAWIVRELQEVIDIVLPSLLPLLIGLVLFAIAIGYAQTGFMITWVKLQPKLDKLNPINGVKRLISLRGLVKAGLSVVKLAVLGSVLWWNIADELPLLMFLPELPFTESATLIGKLAMKILWWIAVPLVAISLLDMIYQRWQHARDMRMSKQEIKDESKQTEGDPEVKNRIKRAQREIARRRMMDEVPQADVIITNPTHWAVALKYERAKMTAPTVTAKGTDQVALRIRAIATENRIPIVEDPPLARGLCRGVRLGDEIPPRFYKAVAAVLSHIMRMKREAS